jgi:hypothetical protein
MHRRSRAEIVDFSGEFKENETISYCKHCLEFGFKVPLKNRIYPEGEPIPVDHDQFRQCHDCGLIVTIYELERESKIQDAVSVSDNPFDSGKLFLGVDSRSARRKARKAKENFGDINDPDLKRELASHQTQLISYSES